MTSNRPFPVQFGRVTAIAGDHARLDRVIETIKALAESARTAELGAHAAISALFGGLLATMARHFAAEESECYFGALAAERPSLAASVEELCAEHTQLLEVAEDLLGLWSGEPKTPEIRSHDLAAQLDTFAERLQAHEQTESALMHTYLFADV